MHFSSNCCVSAFRFPSHHSNSMQTFTFCSQVEPRQLFKYVDNSSFSNGYVLRFYWPFSGIRFPLVCDSLIFRPEQRQGTFLGIERIYAQASTRLDSDTRSLMTIPTIFHSNQVADDQFMYKKKMDEWRWDQSYYSSSLRISATNRDTMRMTYLRWIIDFIT